MKLIPSKASADDVLFLTLRLRVELRLSKFRGKEDVQGLVASMVWFCPAPRYTAARAKRLHSETPIEN